jgi:hypothetical protein
MAKMRRVDSKAALGRQRADLRRGAPGAKHRVGDAAAASAHGRAAELARVRELRAELDERQRAAHSREPLSVIASDVLAHSARLARALVGIPFRMLGALRGHRPVGAEA